MRVLYCGDPGSIREADYRSFLDQHFAKVAVEDLRKLNEDRASGHDVIICDWTNCYDGKGSRDQSKAERLRAPGVTESFRRPTILIGEAGGRISLKLKLKIDWLCLCLNGPAHTLALEHPLLHSPLRVNPVLEEIATPEDFPYVTNDMSLGATMKVWRLQTKDYPANSPGLVSTLYGFADSPDAEVIARGVSKKGPDTVTLGRQANFFLWGFSAPPADMTPAGQRLFVNVVSYMPQFDGQAPLVRSTSRAREWALRYAMIPRFQSDEWRQCLSRQYRAMFDKHPEWIPQKYQGDGEACISERIAREQQAEAEFMTVALPEPLCVEFGMDAEKYLAYYRENLEYLRPDDNPARVAFVVDEDAKAVSPSNRRVDLLERCVVMLERKDRSDLAHRLLKRYAGDESLSASQWRAWLDQNRSRLFFSDVGGYKFFIAPATKSADHVY